MFDNTSEFYRRKAVNYMLETVMYLCLSSSVSALSSAFAYAFLVLAIMSLGMCFLSHALQIEKEVQESYKS